MNPLKTLVCALTIGVAALAVSAPAQAGPRENIIASFGAGPANPANGQAMFLQTESVPGYGGGKPETPNCTTCHGKSPQQGGQTRTGKPIDPMAVSRTPDRYTDPEKVAKWFLRNCQGVIGRECTPQEKVDFISFMMTQ